MFRTVKTTLLCLFSLGALSQQAHTDSLWKILQSSKEDTAKVLASLAWGDRFAVSAPDTAMYYYTAAAKMATHLGWKSGMGQYVSHVIRLLNDQGKYQEALDLCLNALHTYTDNSSKKDLVRAYNNVANEYQYLGYLSAAAENYLRAVQLAEAINERNYIKILSNNLASIFFQLGQYDKAYAYAHSSNGIARQLRDTQGIAFSLVNMGISEHHLGRLDSALQHFRELILLARTLDDYTFTCDAYNNTAAIHLEQHRTELAKAGFDTVRRLGERHGNPNYQILGLGGLADVFIALKRFPQADTCVTRAIALARSTSDRNNLVQLMDKAATIEEGLGHWKGALAWRKSYESLNDSLLNEKTRDHINELESRYQTALKDRQLAESALQLEKSRRVVQARNLQLYLLASGLVLLAVLFALGWRLFRQRQRLNRQALTAIEKESEVKLLRAVLQGQEVERNRIAKEMHDDMGAGLTTILYLSQSLKNETNGNGSGAAEKIVRTTTGLVDTMNEIIWSMNKRYDTLEDLVAYIRHKCVELLEQNGRDYRLEIPENIPALTLNGEVRRNIFLVVKEALNNALKYSPSGTITIKITMGEDLAIEVKDEGHGIFASTQRAWGNGLTNMKERMALVGGTLDISGDAGTTVSLKMPLLVEH